jgi:hypothetical protein
MIGFRRSHAVIIGIDGYGESIPPLRTAVHDATEIGRVLGTAYGYSVHLLTEDVSLSHLKSTFGEFLPKEVEPDDRVLSTSPATASRWTATTGRPATSSHRTPALMIAGPFCR